MSAPHEGHETETTACACPKLNEKCRKGTGAAVRLLLKAFCNLHGQELIIEVWSPFFFPQWIKGHSLVFADRIYRNDHHVGLVSQ